MVLVDDVEALGNDMWQHVVAMAVHRVHAVNKWMSCGKLSMCFLVSSTWCLHGSLHAMSHMYGSCKRVHVAIMLNMLWGGSFVPLVKGWKCHVVGRLQGDIALIRNGLEIRG